jgi:hypothetical protein
MANTYTNATLDAVQDFLIDKDRDPRAWLVLTSRIDTLYEEHAVAVLTDAFGTDDDDSTPQDTFTDGENAAWIAWLEEFQREHGADAPLMDTIRKHGADG